MKTIIIYTGIRKNGDKRVYSYYEPTQGETLQFAKRLASFEAIGSEVETEREGNTFHRATITGFTTAPDILDRITGWHIEERAAIEALNAIADAKKFDKGIFEKAVAEIRSHTRTLSSQHRARIARYIFEQIIK